MTQFTIPIIEYASAKGGALLAPPLQPFVVNDRQLVVSMVRSTLTVNSGKGSRKYMAAIVRPTLEFLLDWSHAPHLRVSTAFLDVVRDFSVTGRIGELAQGVSFAYWKWARGYSSITDFGPWAKKLVPPYSGKKSPDYVMLNPTTGGIAIMEAKGTRSANHKAPMGRALRQCKAALAHVPTPQGFGSVLTLDSINPAGFGVLHIRDPENIAEVTEEMKYYLFRRSYASWFDLVGNADLADWCREWFQNGINSVRSVTQIASGRQDPISPLRSITAMALGFDPARTSFELDPEIAAALANLNAFKQTNWRLFSERMQAQPDPEQKLIRFPDGTSIVERLA